MDGKRLGIFMLLASAALVGRIAMAAERLDSITWLSSAPAHSDSRAQNELLIQFLDGQLGLPKASKTIQANAKRSWQMIAAGEKACHVATLLTKERTQIAFFSLAAMSLPPRLIVTHGVRQSLPLNPAGEVELPRLLHIQALAGALVEGRSYGEVIDNMLAARPRDPDAVSFYSAADFGATLPTMLARGRAHYTIEHPQGVEQMARQSPDLASLDVFTIAGASEPVYSGVACPQTPWGRLAIQAIEHAFATPQGMALIRKQVDAVMSADEQRRHAVQLQQLLQRRNGPFKSAPTKP